jgi:hypothetical protein
MRLVPLLVLLFSLLLCACAGKDRVQTEPFEENRVSFYCEGSQNRLDIVVPQQYEYEGISQVRPYDRLAMDAFTYRNDERLIFFGLLNMRMSEMVMKHKNKKLIGKMGVHPLGDKIKLQGCTLQRLGAVSLDGQLLLLGYRRDVARQVDACEDFESLMDYMDADALEIVDDFNEHSEGVLDDLMPPLLRD